MAKAKKVTVTKTNAIVYKRPTTASAILKIVTYGTTLTASSHNLYSDYYQVIIDNEIGYINSSNVVRGGKLPKETTDVDKNVVQSDNVDYNSIVAEITGMSSGSSSTSVTASELLTDNLTGIFGMPYQFMDSVDRRLDGTQFGRKYAEKIVGRMPLLFLTPGKQSYMSDFSSDEKKGVLASLTDMGYNGTQTAVDEIVSREGKYYTFEFAYADYYQYVNPMCNMVAKLMGIGDQSVTIGGTTGKLSSFDWSKGVNDKFKTFFSSKENVMFYMNSSTSISESFSNDTKESSLLSTVNGLSDTAKEIQFITGDSKLAETLDNVADSADSVLSSINSVIEDYIGGTGVLKGVMGNISTVLSGGKMVFPELWSDSDCSRSYDVDIKLRAPDCDPVSVYLNCIVPFIHLLAMTAPRQFSNNGYSAPFLVRAFYKGCFNVDMGIITSLSVSKGKEMSWNDDGLPTEMDISFSIKDLYSSFYISNNDDIGQMMNNTSLMDYLCNMAGINLAKPELARQLQVYMMLQGSKWVQYPNKKWNEAAQSISTMLSKLYGIR